MVGNLFSHFSASGSGFRSTDSRAYCCRSRTWKTASSGASSLHCIFEEPSKVLFGGGTGRELSYPVLW